MDLSTTIAPKSDQLNADDLMAGPETVTITGVSAGNAEQPVNVELAEFPARPFKPSKSMRRVMVAAWGKDTDVYTGRRMTLYRDPAIKFGGEVVGGIRISHMSDLKDGKPFKIALTVTRGKRSAVTIQPLPDAPARAPEPTVEEVAAATSPDALREMWHRAGPERQEQIKARVAELNAAQEPPAESGGES